MHELSIALNILDIAADESAQRGDTAIHAVHVQLGPFSGVVRQALESAFNLARETSRFPSCRLVIEEIPLIVYCRQCDAEHALPSMQWLRCPVCGGGTPDVISGNELDITAMEIDDTDQPIERSSAILSESTS